MNSIKEKAYAKLNISLDVSSRRQDGYHDMVMVMQTISLFDQVELSLDDSGKVRARTNLPFIPGDERNLAVKAALKFLEATGHEGQGMFIRIEKKVPVGAGMGGRRCGDAVRHGRFPPQNAALVFLAGECRRHRLAGGALGRARLFRYLKRETHSLRGEALHF